jgi:succinate dehydrogenase / fumarate reductase, flavoprotein subunit
MQGLADGYFVSPYTVGNYLAQVKPGTRPKTDAPEFKQAEENVASMTKRLLENKGKQPVSYFHKKLGQIMWKYCGMARTAEGLKQALVELPALREEFWQNVNVPGSGDTLNQSLENAGRVADFIELGELMCRADPRRKLWRPFSRRAPASRW